MELTAHFDISCWPMRMHSNTAKVVLQISFREDHGKVNHFWINFPRFGVPIPVTGSQPGTASKPFGTNVKYENCYCREWQNDVLACLWIMNLMSDVGSKVWETTYRILDLSHSQCHWTHSWIVVCISIASLWVESYPITMWAHRWIDETNGPLSLCESCVVYQCDDRTNYWCWSGGSKLVLSDIPVSNKGGLTELTTRLNRPSTAIT